MTKPAPKRRSFRVEIGNFDAVEHAAPKPTAKVVYLMRGLPSCGKSHRSKQLAGTDGVICETDEFFFTQVGQDVKKFDYSSRRLQEARDWNYDRFVSAIDRLCSPIVVDRGNGLNLETQRYARYAIENGYSVSLAEPNSSWWQELRVLLKYKKHTGPVLDEWAKNLAKMNRSTHRTPSKTIRRWMQNWVTSISIESIMSYSEPRPTNFRTAEVSSCSEQEVEIIGDKT